MTENEAINALKLEGGLQIDGKAKRVAQFFEGLSVAEKVLEEIQQYKAIGTVEEIRFMKSACEMNDDVLNSLANSVREKMKYEAIGTLEEFKALKDAEEQGLLLKLPCKVGTPVYYVQKCICPYSCEKCGAFRWVENCYCDYKGRIFERKFDYSHLNAFGNIIFLTKEEAEQALKNMKK